MMRWLFSTALVAGCVAGLARADDLPDHPMPYSLRRPSSSLDDGGPANSPLEYVRPGGQPIARSSYSLNDGGPTASLNDSYRHPVEPAHGDGKSDSLFGGPPDGHTRADCGCGGFYVDVGFILAEPMWKKDTALSVRSNSGAIDGATVQDFEFDYGMNVGPRVWIGYVGDGGLGIRARYWEFDDSSRITLVNNGTSSTPVVILSDNFLGLLAEAPNTGDTLAAHAKLNLNVADLEVTQTVNFGFCSLLYAAGVRYGRLEQKYDVTLVPVNGTDVSTLHSSQSFEGVGPTIAYEFRRPLGCGFSLYHSSRVAGLFGMENDHASMSEGSTTGTVRTAPVANRRDNFFGMGEIEVGAEWAKRFGEWDVSVQTAFVGMLYDYVGFPGFSMMVGVKH